MWFHMPFWIVRTYVRTYVCFSWWTVVSRTFVFFPGFFLTNIFLVELPADDGCGAVVLGHAFATWRCLHLNLALRVEIEQLPKVWSFCRFSSEKASLIAVCGPVRPPPVGRSDQRCVAGLTGRVRAQDCFVGSRVFLVWEGMFQVSIGFYPELDVEEGL